MSDINTIEDNKLMGEIIEETDDFEEVDEWHPGDCLCRFCRQRWVGFD